MTKNGEFLISIRCKVYEVMNELKKHEMELQKIQNLRDAGIYDMNYILELRDNENTRFYNADASLRNELKQRVDNLFDSLAEAKANINNPTFTNALNLISLLGAEMDGKTLYDIISNFQGQLAELHLLKKACEGAGVGTCIARFDDFMFEDGHQEAMRRQTSNLLIFSHSFNITAEILGENLTIDAESVVKDASRTLNNNRMVL